MPFDHIFQSSVTAGFLSLGHNCLIPSPFQASRKRGKRNTSGAMCVLGRRERIETYVVEGLVAARRWSMFGIC